MSRFHHPIMLELLESRRLLATISVSAFGAIPNDGGDDTVAIQNAINASAGGDTVQFSVGQYDIGQLTVRSSRNYRGVLTATGSAQSGTVIHSSGSDFGFNVEPEGHDIRIFGFRFEGPFNAAAISMGAGGTYRMITIIDNQFADMPTHAIQITNDNEDVRIERNIFTGIRGYGVIEVFNCWRMSYQFNRIIDSAHGGHIAGPRDDCTFSFNHMTGLTHMGLEIQTLNSHTSDPSVATNLIVEGNIIYNWRSTNSGPSMGLSIPIEASLNTTIRDNYINCTLAPGQVWLPGDLPAIGTALESGYDTGSVTGNVIGGTFWFQIGTGGVRQPPTYTNLIQGNRIYGQSAFAAEPIVGWPNRMGIPSSWTEGTGNQFNLPVDQMPPPDAWLLRMGDRAQLPGDANGDGVVNLRDWNILAAHFGHGGASLGEGDLNGDGLVNLQDFNILIGNFGRSLTF